MKKSSNDDVVKKGAEKMRDIKQPLVKSPVKVPFKDK